MTWIVVGASAGLGRALSEALARRRKALLLVASDSRDLAPLAGDLSVRFGSHVHTIAHDAGDPAGLADRISTDLPAASPLEGCLFPLGAMAEADDGTLPPAEAERLVRVNLLAVVSVVGRLLPRMIAQGHGTLVGFGSVAAVRGRGRNVVYAAGKRALESYFESLRHLGEGRGLNVLFYRLGYLDTNLSFGQRLLLPRADPRVLAEKICRDLGRRGGSRPLPWFWGPVSWAVRGLPWPVFRRLRF